MKLTQLTLLTACLAVAAGVMPSALVKRFGLKVAFERCISPEGMQHVQKQMISSVQECANVTKSDQPFFWFYPIDVMEMLQEATYYYQSGVGLGLVGPVFANDLNTLSANNAAFQEKLTCGMKKAGYLKEDGSVYYSNIKASIEALNTKFGLPDAVRQDMVGSVDICRDEANFKASQTHVNPSYLNGFQNQLFFFRCVKDLKIEACMKEDFRKQLIATGLTQGTLDFDKAFDTIFTANMFSAGDTY